MMLITASVAIAGASMRVASGNSGNASFMNPYVPIFSSTPARITEPAVGASTCASGSHVCSGTIGTLIANDSANAASSTVCTGSESWARYKIGECKRRDSGRCVERIHEIDHRRQHQDASERGVQHELQRRVDAALSAPDADDQKQRNQHRLPEQIEDEKILRDERAEHRELQQKHHRVKQLLLLADRVNAPATTSGARKAVSSTSRML